MNCFTSTLETLTKSIRDNTISSEEKQELIDTNLVIIEDLILSDPMLCAKSNYREIMVDNISEILEIQLEHIMSISTDYHIQELVNSIINESIYIYHRFFAPKREYGDTFIRKKPNVKKMQEKVDYLSNIPQPDQRTEEWYIFRHKYLTASSLWKVFSTPGSRNQLIYDKCKPLDTSKYKGFCTTSPMHWGHKYEPVSIFWYERMFNTKVSDFGCIPHRNIDYIAASPDGINTCPNSDRFGRMLEVKNIVNRDITGIPKPEYWIQMQIQMEVCELNECDFLETRFKEYEDEDSFNEDGTFQFTKDGKHKGIILFFVDGEEALYEYAPFMCTAKEYEEWENRIMKKNNNLTWVQNLYWKLEEISCVLVLRNKTWFKGAKPVLDDFWNIIQREKGGEYINRAPKKRSKISSPNCITGVNKCLINIDTLTLPKTQIQEVVQENTKVDNSTKIINISTESYKKQ